MSGKLWFKRKTYGFGWTPATWEGWLCILIYLIFVTIVTIFVNLFIKNETAHLFVIVGTLFAASTALILISYIKGEAPRWQWGNSKS